MPTRAERQRRLVRTGRPPDPSSPHGSPHEPRPVAVEAGSPRARSTQLHSKESGSPSSTRSTARWVRCVEALKMPRRYEDALHASMVAEGAYRTTALDGAAVSRAVVRTSRRLHRARYPAQQIRSSIARCRGAPAPPGCASAAPTRSRSSPDLGNRPRRASVARPGRTAAFTATIRSLAPPGLGLMSPPGARRPPISER